MANSIWQKTIQDDSRNNVAGAQIDVFDEVTGLRATIFSTLGGASLTNPFFADPEGFAVYYAGPGTYRVVATDTGTGQTKTHRYIRLGDAASRDSSTAVGDVMVVGDFSIGADAVRWQTTNLNDINKTDFYDVDTSDTNKPASTPGTVSHVENSVEASATQFFISSDNSLNATRARTGATWTAWQELGGLLEYGTNANGSYWKYLDGLLVSAQSGIQGDALGNGSGSAGFTDSTTSTFPHAYITTPFVIASSQRVGANVIARSATTTSVSMQFFLLAASTADMTYLAIGNWK
jgi:hypothetical protein